MNTYTNYLKHPAGNTLSVIDAVEIYDSMIDALSKCLVDTDVEEIIEEFKIRACEYAKIRMMWEFLSQEEKMEKDESRTMLHNCFIDSVNIIARYIKNEGQDDSFREKLGDNRKRIGDFASFIAYMLAIENR